MKNVALVEMSVVSNCVEVVDIRHCFLHPEFDCKEIFESYAKSCDSDLRVMSKLILCKLSSLLTPEQINDLLIFESKDMQKFLTAFEDHSTAVNRDIQVMNFIFSGEEVICALSSLIQQAQNKASVVDRNISSSLAAVIGCGEIQEQKAGCELLWKLMTDPSFCEQIIASELPFDELLKSLQSSSDADLSLLASSILLDLQNVGENG